MPCIHLVSNRVRMKSRPPHSADSQPFSPQAESRADRDRAELLAAHRDELDAARAALDDARRRERDAAFAAGSAQQQLRQWAAEDQERGEAARLKLAECERAAADRVAHAERERAALSAQLQILQLQNADLNALMDRPRVGGDATAKEVQRLREREAELRSVIARLIKAEEATEGAFTCLACVAIYRKPVTCIPCGHSFCLACIERTGHCQQCGPAVQVSYYPNDLLDQLTAKYVYRKQALSSLRLMDPGAVGVAAPERKAAEALRR
jgi:hypothetical protein